MGKSVTVRPGDTLSRIARKFRTTVKRLAALNCLPDPDRIRAGQVLHLPDRPKALDAPLGSLSRRYEVGDRGPGTVSSGTGDPGGVSYGSYQLATRQGRPAEFLNKEGARWADRFAGCTPGSASFSACWQACAAEAPEAFEAAQHAYIERTHYAPQAALLMREAGLDLRCCAPAVREAVWSTAVQHGPGTRIVLSALTQTSVDPRQPDFDRALITAIYRERGRTAPDGALAWFRSSSRAVQAAVARRLRDECRDALAMLGP